MTKDGLTAVEPFNKGVVLLRDLILRVKKSPGQTFRVKLWPVEAAARKACTREKARFADSEPNISIESHRDPKVEGWGVYATYMPPGMIRDDT